MLLCLDGPRMTFSAANAAYRAFYRNFAMGESLWDSAPVLIDQHINAELTRVYESGEPLESREWRIQLDIDRSGLQEVFIDMTVTPRRASDGTVLGIQILAQNVTERVLARQAAEARARKLQDRYEAVRDSANLMQQALLSPVVPVLPGTDIAAAYLVATEETAAGGDWFDVITGRGGGDVYLVVGDVVGHGVQAAGVMAQLRTAVRMQLHAGAGLAQALTAVDHFATEIPGAAGATVCVVRLDPGTGEVEYCTAGHPPPLIVTADGSAAYVEPTGARPLAAGHEFTTRTAHLAHGDVVLLYSDGIIERPGRPLPASTAEVVDVAVRVLHGKGFPLDTNHAPVQRLCAQAIEMLLRATGYSDDITLLAAQRRPPPPALHADIAADEHAEPAVRARLREWLDALGGDFVSGQILEHAVTEFVANAVEHAYASTTSGRVVIDGALDNDGYVRVTVADCGTWRHPTGSDPGRGRGLSIAQAMVADTSIDRADTGTTVTAVHRLTRAAHIVTDPQVAHTIPAKPVTNFDAAVEDDGLIIVVGDVDTSAAAVLAGVLATQSRAGTAPLTVDLSAVTHLGSAAVSVLSQACRRAEAHESTCTLLAPPGSTAHHVLSLVGLI